jgi:hypothetical protein
VLHRRPFLRPVVGVGLIGAGFVGVVGGLSLPGPGLVAVGVAGALAACLAWGIVRESIGPRRRSPGEAAVLAAAWTIGVLLVLSGTAVLAGGMAAALLGGLSATIGLIVLIARSPHGELLMGKGEPVVPTGHGNLAAPPEALADPRLRSGVDDSPVPVRVMSTEALGQEWLESTAALTGPLEPAVRTAIVGRRQEALDELERRDPEGFLRWLTAGPVLDSDPAGFVRGRTAGDWTAGTDAA